MTVTTTDFEVFVEAHPVGAIPCDKERTNWSLLGIHLGSEAQWVRKQYTHCEGVLVTDPLCGDCTRYVRDCGEVRCSTCGASFDCRDYLISIERLEAK